jgi:hypothetical protein
VNFQFPSAPELAQYRPEKLLEIASKLPNSQISLPTVDKVLQAIEQGKADQVSQLEWVYCIHAKAQWDEKNLDRREQTSLEIWNVAINNSWLQHQLLWRLALYYSGKYEVVIASSLAESFGHFTSFPQINNLLEVQIIQALRSTNPSQELARIACEQRISRTELLNQICEDLPIWIPVFNQFIEYVAPYFSTIISPNKQQVNWLLRCFNEMSQQQQFIAVNHLLTYVPKDIASNHPQLVEWLHQHYRNGGGWYQLSEQARQNLREWIGAINYADFQRLVERIFNRLHLENWEANQLLRRKEFWANYSNRFEQLRILLPQSSLNAIGYQLSEDVSLLEDDGSDTTEVCIFDFGEWLVAEFFRGRGSETRLFPNNAKNQRMLFRESKLSVKRIRCLGGEKHDHRYLWQVSCRQWLENKSIYPNPDIQPSREPRLDQLRDRERQVELWRSDIQSLEREAKAYCDKIGFLII